mmetsp:Transcript_55158/g.130075  ORF Transcript_55158/g.130075 Transcript_55158/m.130075 type:complete len:231 (+) Transcript_55158:103-795(+)
MYSMVSLRFCILARASCFSSSMIFAMISSTIAFSRMNSAYAAAFASSCSAICSLRICLAASASVLRCACFSSSARMSLIRDASICRSTIAFLSLSCSSNTCFSCSCFLLSWFMYAARSFCSRSRSSGASARTFSSTRSSRNLSFFLRSSSCASWSSFSASPLFFSFNAAAAILISISRSCAISAACLALRFCITRSSLVAFPMSMRSRLILASYSCLFTSSANVCCMRRS